MAKSKKPEKDKLISVKRPYAVTEIAKDGLTGKRLAQAALDGPLAGARLFRNAIIERNPEKAINQQLGGLEAGLDIVTNPTSLIPKKNRSTIAKARGTKKRIEAVNKAQKKRSKKKK